MTTAPTTDQRAPTAAITARAASYGATIWALGFAAVNLYLQAVGIDDASVQQNWATFTAINLGVTALKAFGAAVALATVQQWGRQLPASLVSVCAWGAAATLLLYATYGLVTTAATGDLLGQMLAGGTFRIPTLAYLGFFAAGGSLFAVAARQHQAPKRRTAGLGAARDPRFATAAGNRAAQRFPGVLTCFWW